MDEETRTAIDGLGQQMRAGFARMDRYFELSQAQHHELSASVDRRFDAVDRRFDAVDSRFGTMDDRFTGVEGRLDRLEFRVGAIESELRGFRDWVEVQFADLRAWIRTLLRREQW